MSLVVLADAQDRVGASVTQEQIDGVEAWLASEIGPLEGERAETFFLSERRNLAVVDGLWLSRRTDSVELTNDGDSLTDGVDYRLINGHLITHKLLGAAWGSTLVATYTPTDSDIVVEVIYDVLTYQSINPNLQSVRIGAYSETYATGSASDPVLNAQLTRILPSARLGAYASPFRYRAHRHDRTLIEATGS